MPAKFTRVGLFHLALPYDRIIHARRDPIDTGSRHERIHGSQGSPSVHPY
ncbi:hypothetical protein [Bradyrhizobium sp.]